MLSVFSDLYDFLIHLNGQFYRITIGLVSDFL